MIITGLWLSFLGTFLIPCNAKIPNVNNIGKFDRYGYMDRQLFLNDQEDLHFIVIGDWGTGRRHQKEIAEAMGKFCQGNKCDFIISTGDNFYDVSRLSEN